MSIPATRVFVGLAARPAGAAAPVTPSRSASRVVRIRDRRTRLLIARDLHGIGWGGGGLSARTRGWVRGGAAGGSLSMEPLLSRVRALAERSGWCAEAPVRPRKRGSGAGHVPDPAAPRMCSRLLARTGLARAD